MLTELRYILKIRKEEQILLGPYSIDQGEELLVCTRPEVQCHSWTCDHGLVEFGWSELLELLRRRYFDTTVSYNRLTQHTK